MYVHSNLRRILDLLKIVHSDFLKIKIHYTLEAIKITTKPYTLTYTTSFTMTIFMLKMSVTNVCNTKLN